MHDDAYETGQSQATNTERKSVFTQKGDPPKIKNVSKKFKSTQ